ncbi:ComEC/Rec2 family competence protein [Chloroflexota bacterium]
MWVYCDHAILIQTPEHHNILIDGGPSPQAIKLELSKKLSFWDRKIDLCISTQPQSDHVTGIVEILNYYNVKQVILSGIPSDSFIYNQILKIVHYNKIPYDTVYAGQVINLGDIAFIEVLHPPELSTQEMSNDINNNSLVLRLSYKEISFLFTADIGEETEWNLISQRTYLKSTVLKVAHHGSRSSTTLEFLTVATPEVAVISAGNNNVFNHPHPEVLERLNQKIGSGKVLSTSCNGTIEFVTDGNTLWIKTEH